MWVSCVLSLLTAINLRSSNKHLFPCSSLMMPKVYHLYYLYFSLHFAEGLYATVLVLELTTLIHLNDRMICGVIVSNKRQTTSWTIEKQAETPLTPKRRSALTLRM